jgi:hypothetical protein
MREPISNTIAPEGPRFVPAEHVEAQLQHVEIVFIIL